MNVEVFAKAKQDLIDSIDFYNRQSEGLGYEFAAEVRKTIDRIVLFPDAWANITKRTKRCRCDRFPYGVVYQIREEKIFIISIMHLHRDPDSWKDRV